MNPSKSYHIPYRTTKLTLVLKDSLELKSFKHCKTTIIANISPSIADIGQTKNTLRYITPIKITAKEKVKFVMPVNDEGNPATWDHDFLVKWTTTYSKGKVDPEKFCPFESGRQIMSIPESEFKHRLYEQKISEMAADKMYKCLWGKVVDARSKFFKVQQNKAMAASKAKRADLEKE